MADALWKLVCPGITSENAMQPPLPTLFGIVGRMAKLNAAGTPALLGLLKLGTVISDVHV